MQLQKRSSGNHITDCTKATNINIQTEMTEFAEVVVVVVSSIHKKRKNINQTT